jgi:hypothetical protein
VLFYYNLLLHKVCGITQLMDLFTTIIDIEQVQQLNAVIVNVNDTK